MESGFSAGLGSPAGPRWSVQAGLEDEELMSEGATVESRVGGQGQVTGIAARGRVRSGEGWCAVHGDAMLLTRRFL